MDIKEKVLNNRKNGMAMMLLFIIFYAAAAGIMLVSAITELIPLMLLAIIWISIGWIPFLGLKVLKPQEALVLTLFGKYVGTLKDAGFYWVNPFCSSVNPAAKTKLNQSGDVDGGNSAKSVLVAATGANASANASVPNKKISLKIMTLNNNRQKINDCLGNPVEIGIAVMWRVTDTAKAVFHVDNYKEYLSCSVTVPCEISCVFILTMWHRMSIRPVTALPMKAACVVPAKLLQDASAMRSRRK